MCIINLCVMTCISGTTFVTGHISSSIFQPLNGEWAGMVRVDHLCVCVCLGGCVWVGVSLWMFQYVPPQTVPSLTLMLPPIHPKPSYTDKPFT